ncbi:ribosomal protein S18-alanine N-acetyltransferase [Candidatus Cloacimonadota bacterium]
MKLNIRKAQASDLSAIMKIEQQSFKEPWAEASFLNEMAQHEVFVLYFEEILMAYICGWKILDEYNITNLAVREDLRKQGLGDLLVSHVMSIHREDCSLIYLEVRESNTAARKLYMKKKFDIVGVRKNYYKSPIENAVIMEYRYSE